MIELNKNLIQDLKVGIISDGKYGERAFENIKRRFQAEWILVPDVEPTIMLDDDITIDIPECDLYISYIRHPDIILQMVELQKPIILGVLPGVGLLKQAKRINPNVIHATSMCSLENNTGIPVIDTFTTHFGRPIYEILIENEHFTTIKANRSSLCGSTEASSNFLVNKEISVENLQEFALSVCHECRAPRFGHTCDKEVAGIIHLTSLFEAFKPEDLQLIDVNFIENIKKEYEKRSENSRLILNQV